MTALLIILGIIAALVLAVTLVRVSVLARFDDGKLSVALRVAGVPIRRRAPATTASKRSRKTTKKAPDGGPKTLELPGEPGELIAAAFAVLDKLRRGVVVRELFARYEVGGDPYGAVLRAGAVDGLVGALAPVVGSVLKIKKSSILVSPNFVSEGDVLRLRVWVTIRAGALIGVALAALGEYRKLKRQSAEVRKDGRRKTPLGGTDGNDDAEHPRNGRRKYHRGSTDNDA